MITRAVGLVAAVKYRRAHAAMMASQEYLNRLSSILEALTAGVLVEHPLLLAREEKRRTILVFGSDRGLCGSFNREVLSAVHEALGSMRGDSEIDLLPVGDRMASLLRASGLAHTTVEHHLTSGSFLEAGSAAVDMLEDWFVSGLTDRIDVISARPGGMHSAGRIGLERIVPVGSGSEPAGALDCIYEPSIPVLLDALVPACVRASLALTAACSETAEQTARLTAMTAATKNADDMLADLKLASNKLRQAAITRELTEVVAGTE